MKDRRRFYGDVKIKDLNTVISNLEILEDGDELDCHDIADIRSICKYILKKVNYFENNSLTWDKELEDFVPTVDYMVFRKPVIEK